MANDDSSNSPELINKINRLESKLRGQLDRKEYQLALMTTEELISLSNDIGDFDIEKWMSYYTQLKEHLFMKTFDEKYEIIMELIQNQEIITINRFQNLMKLDFVDDFQNIVKSLPESEILSFDGNQMSFSNPGDDVIGEKVDKFLNDLYVILQ